MGRLENQVAIITGAASGMGLAQAKLFAQEGAKVVLADVSPAGQSVADEIGETAAFFRLDVSDEANWAAIVDFTLEKFGKISVLINTAGIVFDTVPMESTTAEAYERILAVNLRGVFFGMRAVVEPMKKNGGGSIVNVASAAALISSPGLSAYSASKGGVRSLSKTAAKEVGQFGIRVNTIFPGSIKTPIVTPSQMEIVEKYMAEKTPLGRMGEASEIATATLFLASSEASYITGAELVVDGGFLA